MPIIYEENNNSVNTSTDNASTQTESQSRVEEALQAIVDGSDGSQLPASQSRVEALLKEIFDSGGSSGGGGGSADYDTIINAAIQKLTPDYENVEPVGRVESGNHIYTATKRCIISLMFSSTERNYRVIRINGKEVAEDAPPSGIVASDPSGGSPMINGIWLPLRAGDVVTIGEDQSFIPNKAIAFYYIIPYKS